MHLLIADEDFDHRVVRLLREATYDVITLQDLGLAGLAIPDEQVFAIAVDLGRCVLTFNRKDFIRIHREQSNHPGIIICTRNPDVSELFTRLTEILAEETDLASKLLRVYRAP